MTLGRRHSIRTSTVSFRRRRRAPSTLMCAAALHARRMPLRACRRSARFKSLENVLLPVPSSGNGCSRALHPNGSAVSRLGWIFAAAAVVVLVVGALTSTYVGSRSGRDHVFSEIADLHVATLASSSPVDVISSDRHTVKPWFQGKIPFAFDLPELQNSEFSLLGGRMTYLDQTPGAHLIYDVRKHHISVFVFQERSLRARLDENSSRRRNCLSTWKHGVKAGFAIS